LTFAKTGRRGLDEEEDAASALEGEKRRLGNEVLGVERSAKLDSLGIEISACPSTEPEPARSEDIAVAAAEAPVQVFGAFSLIKFR
jgi:hypothetical protein